MTAITDSFLSGFAGRVRQAVAAHPCVNDVVVLRRAPAVVDVMGGIAEDGGGLVLTSTLPYSTAAAVWRTPGREVRVRQLRLEGAEADEFCLEVSDLSTPAADLLERCRNGGVEWAAAAFVVLRQALEDGLLPALPSGLGVVIGSDAPAGSDLGGAAVTSAALTDALCALSENAASALAKARTGAAAFAALVNCRRMRTMLTALCPPPFGSLLQVQFQPQLSCEPLELPAGIVVAGLHAALGRPIPPQRMIQTRVCAEMGLRMIAELKRLDGAGPEGGDYLAAIGPAEYVERYRDRLPTKIMGQAFLERFGAPRGLNGQIDPAGLYKIRSRAEHQIYENRRVHEFVAALGRSRRTGDPSELVRAGELMYSSHWSHSQRCGIGGVEPDALVHAIRARGAGAGLYGAKVTGGGEGGEMAVLMRDDESARNALEAALASASDRCGRTIRAYSLPRPMSANFQPIRVGDA